MSKQKIKLVGSYHGSTNIQKYKRYQIEESYCLTDTYQINSFDIRFNSQSNDYFVYHIFETIHNKDDPNKKLGRWYNCKLTKDCFNWDDHNKTLTYSIPEYESDWENTDGEYKIIKNVPMIIKFTQNGWVKLKEIFQKYD